MKISSRKSSLYPTYPENTYILAKQSVRNNDELSKLDQFLVYSSSLLIVGSVIWVPASLLMYCYRKWKQYLRDYRLFQKNCDSDDEEEKQRKKKKIGLYYGCCLASMISIVAIMITGPHRHPKVGKFLNVRKWRLWQAWLNYISFEVITDCIGYTKSHQQKPMHDAKQTFDYKKDPAIFAVIPHGLFPFSLAFSALPDIALQTFGFFRPIVATATNLFPFVNMFLSWIEKVDASRSSVDRSLLTSDISRRRIGLSPGGIHEMFEGYPKRFCHMNDECVLLKDRKGFIRMALKHKVPVIPIYCFGASKMMRRVEVPFLERISKILRISICLVFGKFGLPIPYRQRLLYVMGNPILPPPSSSLHNMTSVEERKLVDEMHKKFCDELIRMFEKYKASYGWDHKQMQLK